MHNKKFKRNQEFYMIRKEKIEQNESFDLPKKQQEIRDLRQLVGEEMIADFT